MDQDKSDRARLDDVRAETEALERRAAELERTLASLREAQQKLVHGERLAAIGQLAAGLAQEMTGPAMYALVDVQGLIARDAAPSPADREALRHVHESLQRLVAVTRELRLFARGDELRLEDLDPNDLVERALRITARALHARADLVIRRGAPPRVRGDARQLVQVVVNLLLNAVSGLPPRRSSDHVVVVTTAEREGKAVIRVADDGPGIARELLDRVFEPFSTARPAGEGSGMGLGVSRRIIEDHGGTVRVESVVQRGSAFEIELPGAPPRESDPPRSDLPRSSRTAPRRRLLVVDDDDRVLESYRRWLSRRYQVEAALGAVQALEAIARGAPFDAVLCDVSMPDVSGMELHRIVSERWPALADRFLFMVGSTIPDDAAQFLDERPQRRLEKPFRLDELDVRLAALDVVG